MSVDSRGAQRVARNDDDTQTAQGHYISFSEAGGVRLRPWAIRWSTVEQLDAMAATAGFVVAERWEDAQRTPFTTESPRHVTVVWHKSPPRPP